MNEDDKLLEELLEETDGIDYDTKTGEFTVTMLEDIDQMMDLYRTNAIVQEFIEREIRLKQRYVHEIERDHITGYEVAGFCWFHAGEQYTLDPKTYYES